MTAVLGVRQARAQSSIARQSFNGLPSCENLCNVCAAKKHQFDSYILLLAGMLLISLVMRI